MANFTMLDTLDRVIILMAETPDITQNLFTDLRWPFYFPKPWGKNEVLFVCCYIYRTIL